MQFIGDDFVTKPAIDLAEEESLLCRTPSSSKLNLKCNFSCGDFVLHCELSAKDLKIGLQSCADLVSLPQKTLNNCSSTSHYVRANPVNAETEKDVPHLGLATGTNPSTKI